MSRNAETQKNLPEAKNKRRWLRTQRDSSKTLELVKAYSVPVRDARVSELTTWYANTLQRAISIIWDNIEWRYKFPKISRNKKVRIGLKI
ncbi:MAG: hypothetical protein ACP5OK_07515, partial [Thermoprotei archaeon]